MLPARQSYYSVFTCPTQRVLISRWTPVRCSRPDNLTFFCLYLSNTASLDLPLDAGEVLPARQSYFLCLYLSNTASSGISLDAGEVLPARQSYFSCLYLSNTGVSISHWTPARCSRPDNLTFPVFTCPTRESQSPVGRRAVVLESGLGLESGLETFFYRLGLVLDSLVFGLGLVSDLVIGLAKCSSWSRPSPAIYAFFFSFKTKTLLFRKWVM